MKRWPVLLTLLILSYSIYLSPSAYATGSIGFESYQFSASKIYQGDSDVYVDLEIINNGNSSLVLHGGFAHFKWQATNESFLEGGQISGDAWDLAKELAPTESYTLQIEFSVPTTVSEDGYPFFFKVFYDDGLEVQWNPRAEDPYAELTIHSMYERIYNTIITSVEEKVAQAKGAGFISPDAGSLLQQAEDYLSNAYSYVGKGEWQNAVSHLQASSGVVTKAYEAEQRFWTYLYTGIIGGVIGIGAVVGAVLFVRRRRKRSSKSISKKVTESSSVE